MQITADLIQWKRVASWVEGRIINDKKGRWRNLTLIHTSSLRKWEDCGNYFLAVTRNSTYRCYKRDIYTN